jgi:HEAT repeat protein
MHAAEALAQIGPDSVPALIPIVKNHEKLRHLAVLVLGEMGPAAKPAVAVLTDALSANDKDLEREIILTLSRIGPDARQAVPALLKILEDETSKSRAAAAYALASIGAKEAIPLLSTAISRKDDLQLQLIASGALVILEPDNDEQVQMALPQLIGSLDDKWPVVRHEAVVALRLIGPRAKKAVAKLTAGLQDPIPTLRVDYLWALAAIGPDAADAVPEIMNAMADNVPSVRYAACFAAGSIGPPASAAVPALEKNLQDRDEFLQFNSAWALARINPRGEGVGNECLKPLLQGLKHSDPRVRIEAAQTLALLGPAARAGLDTLRESLRDEDEGVRKAATDALQKIGDAAP